MNNTDKLILITQASSGNENLLCLFDLGLSGILLFPEKASFYIF